MKKRLLIIVCLAFALCVLSACGDTNGSSSSLSVSSTDSATESVIDSETESSVESDDSQASSETQAEQFSIFYQGVSSYDHSIMEIPTGMMPSTRSYPNEYAVGESVTIDGLEYLTTSYREYEFLGYFNDEACTIAFTGIDALATGPVTIYALIRVSYTTPNA